MSAGRRHHRRFPAHRRAAVGAVRPGHFRGVATIVTNCCCRRVPTSPVLAKRIFQQLQHHPPPGPRSRHPGADRAVATVREHEGSRSRRATPISRRAERTIAPRLYRTLAETAENAALAPRRLPPRRMRRRAARARLRARRLCRICDAETRRRSSDSTGRRGAGRRLARHDAPHRQSAVLP